MYYLPLLIVFSLNAGYVGDHESGSTCLQFYDRPAIHYATLNACKDRIQEILDSIKANPARLHQQLPGPWRYSGKCVVPVIEEAA